MKFSRRKTSKKGRIEIIPMIDVMFFLLATFMLASIYMSKIDSLPVNLTKGKADKFIDKDRITITIDAQNKVFLNKESVSLDDLGLKIKPLINSSNQKVIIVSDQDSKQGVVTQTMLKAKESGATNFSIIVRN
ncbi:MAG: biopolymer transporter ExbD [Pelagibacterales bacterium]|nr:biopolymer transporter ExbD [Pelagibacterales bacterium]